MLYSVFYIMKKITRLFGVDQEKEEQYDDITQPTYTLDHGRQNVKICKGLKGKT